MIRRMVWRDAGWVVLITVVTIVALLIIRACLQEP